MNKRKSRNKRIRAEIRKLADRGYEIQTAIKIVADMFYLSPATVRDIWHMKRRINE